MNTSDVTVYSYMTDDGHRVSFSFGVWGSVDEDRKVDVSIVVDGVERMHTSGHTRLPAGLKLGEWLIFGVLRCLGEHMDEYNRFQLMDNLLSMAMADRMNTYPVDNRHISELTNEQAEWWNLDEARATGRYVLDQIKPAVEEAFNNYPQLRANKETD